MATLIGHSFSTGEPLYLSASDRRRHLYLIGQTGVGKSNTITDIARQDIERGDGVAFIDPHGSAARALLEFIPAHRVRDVVYFDPSDIDRPIGFNPLSVPGSPALIADGIVSAFRHVFADSWGPRLEHFLTNACRTLLEQDGADLLGIPLLFLDEQFRRKCLANVEDPVVRMFWDLEYPTYSERLLSDALSPIFNKVNRVLSSPEVRNILCQPNSSIDLRRMMDDGKILIANVSNGKLGEGNAHLLGALLVTGITQAALSREDTPEHERRVFHLFADEFQNFATDSFASILSEARKYALTLTLAHQYLEQVPERLRQSVFGNSGSFISFRVGAEDAPLVAKHLGIHNPQQLQDLPNYRAYGRFLMEGEPRQAALLKMVALPESGRSMAAEIITNSRNRRGRERRIVEARIERFLAHGKPKKKQKKRSSWG